MILDNLNKFKKTYINKGFSTEEKYKLEGKNEKYLLKVTPIFNIVTKKLEEKYSEVVNELPCCKLLEMKFEEDNIKSLYSWIDGNELRECKDDFSKEELYNLGVSAGNILKNIHQIEIDEKIENWQLYINKKLDKKIASYKSVEEYYPNGKYFVDYINSNRKLLKNRIQTLCHGDFHVGNMMIEKDTKNFRIIDFGTLEINDPYEEFNRMIWNVLFSFDFAKGIINGYFPNKEEIPADFWKLMKLYMAMDILSSIPWAISYGNEQLEIMKNRADKVLEWYNNYKSDIPNFYLY